jgi:sugar phosphate isomerase/epimerase
MKLRSLLIVFTLLFALCARASSTAATPQLGLQTWTCRNMNFEQVVAFATKHGITQLQFIAAQLNPSAPAEENLRKKAVLEKAGLHVYTFGVNATTLDKATNRKLFEFAKLMGIKLIIVEPKDFAQWENLEQLVKEYDIKLAIHNPGKGSVYGDPATVKKILAARDARIGVCLDVGWVTAAGFDAAAIFRDYGDRVFDIHFKDKKTSVVDGKAVAVDTELGQGDSNYAGLFAEIKKSKWSGVLAIETDSKAFAEDPNRLVAEGKNYFAKNLGTPATK